MGASIATRVVNEQVRERMLHFLEACYRDWSQVAGPQDTTGLPVHLTGNGRKVFDYNGWNGEDALAIGTEYAGHLYGWESGYIHAEGDAVGEPPTGTEWAFWLGGGKPQIEVGERVYVVSHGRLRGYAPLTRLMRTERGWGLCREAGAVAVTIVGDCPGFRGYRKRWWPREVERPYPEWKTDQVR